MMNGRTKFPTFSVLRVAIAAVAFSGAVAMTAGADTGEVQTGTREVHAYRAYPGAPPAIPHQVRELKRTNCLSCHEKGGITGTGEVAPKTPHPQRTSCQQCHVVQVTHGRRVESTFEPLGAGTDAVKLESAPPTGGSGPR